MKRNRLSRFLPSHAVRDIGRLLFLSGLVGIVAGFGAVAFFYLLDFSKHYFLVELAGYHPAGPSGEAPLMAASGTEFKRWMLLILPALGGLLSGWIVYSLAPEAEGHGTDAAIETFHFKQGKVRVRVPFVKAVTAALTIGTGGSGGREGPIAQIGSGFGSMLGTWLKLPSYERRILMAAGMGAGVGAIFHAPLAGALFAAEVLYREMDLEHEVIIPAVIASIIAYSVFSLHFGWTHLFVTPGFTFTNPAQLLPYLILALVAAGGSILYIKIFYSTQKMFGKLRLPNHFKPAIGGLIVGGLGYFLPEVLSTGYGVVQAAFNGEVSLWLTSGVYTGMAAAGLLALIALGKMVATAFSIGSGGSGGVFGPAVVIGGALGGVIGIVAQQAFPGMDIQPGAFVVVGMAGFFAAAANTPISTIIMVSEMTGNYNLLVPSMWVCMIAYTLCRRYTIYEKQLPSRFDAPIHLGNMMSSVLKRMTINDVLDEGNPEPVLLIEENTTLQQLLQKFSQSENQSFPVVDGEGNLTGVVDGRLLRSVIGESGVENLVLAAEIAQPAATTHPGESLFSAVQRMVEGRYTELIVVGEDDPKRVRAIVSRNDIITAYNQEILKDLAQKKSI
ncbi:MAG: chloride channel protein [Planctomycetes bacterium]|nr:chloride channel protein [Planctomycetota bacterium]